MRIKVHHIFVNQLQRFSLHLNLKRSVLKLVSSGYIEAQSCIRLEGDQAANFLKDIFMLVYHGH